jgi:hypothetical protein
MIKIILGFPVQVFQSISKSISNILDASKRPVQSSVLTINGLVKAFIVAVMIAGVYFYFEPFGIKLYTSANKNLLILLSSLAGFIGLLISDYSLPSIFKSYFNVNKWSIRKEISIYILRFFFVGLVVMVFGNQTGLTNFNLPLFLLKFTAAGSLLSIAFAFYKENSLRNRFESKAQEINENLKTLKFENTNKNPFPVIKFSGSNDTISIVPNQLVSLDISKYKTDFVYQNIFGTINKTLDITSKDVLEELKEHAQFKQLNDTLYVNFNALYKVKGNGAGFKANVAKIDGLVHVSRRFFIQP